jgi:DnaJ domain
MYIAWKMRPVVGGKKVAFLLDEFRRKHPDCDAAVTAWKPLWCEHRGVGRVASTPLVVHAERRDGRPRQKLVHRLPTIRSCCLTDPFCRAAWWHEVDRTIKFWKEVNGFEIAFIARDEGSIRAKLRAVVPPPTRAGRRDFATYRQWRERERHARRQRIDAAWWQSQEEAARGPDEAPDQARRRADDEWRRYEQFRQAAEASARDCADGWGRRPTADLAERQERTRRGEAHWARFEQAEREQEARHGRWSEGQERWRQEEEERRQEEEEWRRLEEEWRRTAEKWRRILEDLLGHPSGSPWSEVLGLSPAATKDEIKRRYRELAKRHHPDREGGNVKLFVRVKSAYDDAMKQAVV